MTTDPNAPCSCCGSVQFIDLGQLGSSYWVKCRLCGAQICHEPAPFGPQECPSCSEIVERPDTINAGIAEYECECGAVWSH